MDHYKHYILTDAENNVVDGWSSGHVKNMRLDGAICINENGGYQFELLGKVNPPLRNENGICRYRQIGNVIVSKTPEEIQAEVDAKPEKTQPLTTEERLAACEIAILELAGDFYG